MNRVVDLHEPTPADAPPRDWASEKAGALMAMIGRLGPDDAADILAIELRIIRATGVGMGVDQLAAQLLKGLET